MAKNSKAAGVTVCVAIVAFLVGMFVNQSVVDAQSNTRVFELRTYTTIEGRVQQLVTRHRDGAIPLFEKHGMTVIGFWVAADAPRSTTTLTYILAHESREAADRSWELFIDDPRRDDYEHELIVENVERMFLHATDFSAIK